jgi:hypothetical protein
MSTLRAIPFAARIARRLRHACHGLAAALGEEDRDLTLDIFTTAFETSHSHIRLGHGADGFEFVFAILADIFVNRHNHLKR